LKVVLHAVGVSLLLRIDYDTLSRRRGAQGDKQDQRLYAAHRWMHSEQACGSDHDPCDDGGETGEQQQVIEDTDDHRSPPYSIILPIAHPKTLAKK